MPIVSDSIEVPVVYEIPFGFIISAAISNCYQQQEYRTIHTIWVNYNDLTATSLE